jgi:hypothetical protein
MATVLAGAVFLSVAAGAAAPSQISIQSIPPATGATQVDASSPDIRYPFRISNNSAVEATVTIAVRPTSRAGARACAAPGCTLAWTLDGAPVAPEHPQSVIIPSYSAKELIYSGRAENLGVYSSEAIVVPAGAQASDPGTPVGIKVTRGLPNLGDNPVTVSSPGPRTLWFDATNPVRFSVTNQTGESVDLGSGLTAHIQRDVGNQTYAELKDQPNPCARATVPAGGRLDCTTGGLTIRGPGRYRAEVSIANAAAPAGAHADFTVRWPWFIAALVVALGGLLGAFIAGYQNSGRRRALQTADLLDLQAKLRVILESLDPALSPDAQAIVLGVLNDIGDAQKELHDDRDADYSDPLTNWGRRLPLVHRFAPLEAAYRSAGAKPEWDQVYNEARAAVDADVAPGNAQDKLTALKNVIGKNLASSRVAGSSAEDPPEFFFTWRGAATAGELLRTVKWLDYAIMGFSILIATAVAVVTLWKSDPTWGDAGDFLLAFLTGLGLALGGALSIKQLVGGYRLGQVAP